MKIFIATDHAGFELKNKLKEFLTSLGHEVVDKGPFQYNADDDYPDFIRPAAEAVAADKGSLGIVLGGSGQGEAMCANRIRGARAAVYYGEAGTQTDITGNTIDMITSTREHNNANILSLGARFLTEDEVKVTVKKFIQTSFSGETRHIRRLEKLDQ